MQIESRCNTPGWLVIEGQTRCGDARGNCDCDALVHYRHADADALHAVAVKYSWVLRPGGKTVRGRDYTRRMARNDYARLTA